MMIDTNHTINNNDNNDDDDNSDLPCASDVELDKPSNITVHVDINVNNSSSNSYSKSKHGKLNNNNSSSNNSSSNNDRTWNLKSRPANNKHNVQEVTAKS